MDITGVYNAKDIQALSMIPSEGEILILPNTEFTVKLALICWGIINAYRTPF